jgi:hypothetical protein
MEYKEIDIVKSKDPRMKYTAIIQRERSNERYFVNFGNIDKNHYRDSTPLKLYSRLDTLNENTKSQFYNEISKRKLNIKKFSPLYFMAKYLYS